MHKLISVDNEESKGNREVGKTNNFNYDGNVFRFGSIKSSTVMSIFKHNDLLQVITRNTLYTFANEEK